MILTQQARCALRRMSCLGAGLLVAAATASAQEASNVSSQPTVATQILPAPMAQAKAAGLQAAPNQCFARILVPARYETRSEQVLIRPATRREISIPASYKTVSRRVLEQAEVRPQVVEPAEIQITTEELEVRPESRLTVPVNPTYSTRTEAVKTRPANPRIEVQPASWRTEHREVEIAPAHTETRIMPAEWGEVETEVQVSPATTRTVTAPPSFRTEVEPVLVRPELVSYIPVRLPTRKVSQEHLVAEASTRVEALPAILDTVSTPVEIKPARIEQKAIPAAYKIETERVLVKEAHLEWRRGQAWVGQAIEVVPLRSFVVDDSGRFRGHEVAAEGGFAAASGGRSQGILDVGVTPSDNRRLEDDVWCLVEVPAEYQTVQRQVLLAPATVTEEAVPAEYRQVKKKIVVRDAMHRTVEEAARYQTIWRDEIDFDKVRQMGYQFNAAGELVATPSGEPMFKVAAIVDQPGVQVDRNLAPDSWVREKRIPALYKNVTRYVQETPAQLALEEIPARYRTIKQRVELVPERAEQVQVPAQYRKLAVQVLDQPESLTMVDEPAQFQTLTHYELQEAAGTREVTVPAVTRTVEREIVTREARTRETVQPARYRTITQLEVDTPARTEWEDVPAEYKTVSWAEKVADAHEEIRPVLCETNTPSQTVSRVQQALRKAGFSPDDQAGVLGLGTLEAVGQFQQARGMPVHGYLDEDTVRALGVNWQ